MLSNESFITIQGYMLNELKLKGVELITYAVIAGFTQDGQGRFVGTASYIAEWAGCSKRAVFIALNSLVEKGLIGKKERIENNQKFCEYFSLVKNIHTPHEKNSPPPSENFSPFNNITLDKINDNKLPPLFPPMENVRGCRFENSKFCLDECPDIFLQEAKIANPNVNPFEEYKVFKDYWLSRTGQIAVKKDWIATWRNWIRRCKGFTKNKSSEKCDYNALLNMDLSGGELF